MVCLTSHPPSRLTGVRRAGALVGSRFAVVSFLWPEEAGRHGCPAESIRVTVRDSLVPARSKGDPAPTR